jgi:replication initiation protein RepC
MTAVCLAFGVTDRDLAVQAALLSFLPGKMLVDGSSLVVHPSNATLSDRTLSMAESTLRRNLAALVRAGLIARRDSQNDKRHAARGVDGTLAFGFDLRLLLVQAPRIAAGDAARDHALRLCEAAVIRLRDAAEIAAPANADPAFLADLADATRQLSADDPADVMRPCLGISHDGRADARRIMGAKVASVVLAAILHVRTAFIAPAAICAP